MYLLDTNVISELRKAKSGKADKNVISWAKDISPSSLFLSVLSILEIELGIQLVKKRDASQSAILHTWLDTHVIPAFAERILYVDIAVTRYCAKLHAPDPKSDRDALIAATALVHGMTMVTRNVSDFNQTGVTIINPWEPI